MSVHRLGPADAAPMIRELIGTSTGIRSTFLSRDGSKPLRRNSERLTCLLPGTQSAGIVQQFWRGAGMAVTRERATPPAPGIAADGMVRAAHSDDLQCAVSLSEVPRWIERRSGWVNPPAC